MNVKKKIWSDTKKRWILRETGYSWRYYNVADVDGYCTCNICRKQRRIEKLSEDLPDKLFCID